MFIGLEDDFPESMNCRIGDYIVKKESHGIYIGSALCPHRGMPFIECGKAAYNLTCPYHGLPFKPDEELNSFSQLIFNGSVGDGWKFLSQTLSNLGQLFQTEIHTVQCSPQVWMENTMDFGHVAQIHKAGFADLFVGNPYDVVIGHQHSMWSLQVAQSAKDSLKGYANPDSCFKHFVAYPNLSITTFLDLFISIETVIPNLNACNVHTRYFLAKDREIPANLLRAAIKANQTLLKEDRDLCEALQPTYDSTSSLYLAFEQRIKAFREWL